MKKLNHLLITLLLAFSIISCGNDDDAQTESTPEITIAGDWELIGYEVLDGESNITVLGETSSTKYSQVGSNFDYIATFSTSPNIATGAGSYDVTTTYEENTEDLEPFVSSINTEDLEEAPTATWEIIDGNQLVSTVNGNTSTATIEELTEDRLVYISDLSDTPLLDSPDNSDIFGGDFGDLGDFFGGFEIEISTTGKLKTTLTRVSE